MPRVSGRLRHFVRRIESFLEPACSAETSVVYSVQHFWLRTAALRLGLVMVKAIVRRAWTRLSHPRTGVVCALLLAAWCGLGSLLDQFTPNFYHRHLIGCWWAPRWHSLWLVGLFVAMTVWCIHALLQLRAEIAIRSSESGRRMWAVGWALLQAAFACGLGAYVWFIVAAPPEEFLVTSAGIDVHGEFYRTLRIEPPRRDLGPRQPIVAWLERRVGTTTERLRIERAQWWSSRLGNHQLAMARVRRSSESAVFRHGSERVTLATDKPVKRGLVTWILRAIRHRPHEPADHPNRAELEIDGQKQSLPLDPEWAGENAFLGMKESSVVVLRVHRNLNVVLAAVAAALLGLALLGCRLELRLGTRGKP